MVRDPYARWCEPVDKLPVEPDPNQAVGTGARRRVGCPWGDALMARCAAGVIVIAIMELNEPMTELFLTDESGALHGLTA